MNFSKVLHLKYICNSLEKLTIVNALKEILQQGFFRAVIFEMLVTFRYDCFFLITKMFGK